MCDQQHGITDKKRLVQPHSVILEFPYAYFIWIVIAEYKLPHYFNSLLDWHASSVRGLECGGMNNNGQPETLFFLP